MYVTPARLRTMRLGVSLSGIPDIEIAQLLDDAQAVTDAFCNQPLTPVPGNFLGQAIVDEELRFRFPDTEWASGSRKVYPRHWPVRSIDSFVLKVGSESAANIPTDSLVINNKERWVQPTTTVLSNTSGLFGVSGWVVPLGGLAEPLCLLSYQSGWVLAAPDEQLYAIDDTNLTYQGSHGWWLANTGDTPISVTAAGVPVDLGDLTLDRDSGQITFGTIPTGPIRASYSYRLPNEIERAQRFLLEDLLGSSNLIKKGFVSGIQSIKAGEISISRSAPAGGDNMDLWATVPRAAALLAGYRLWTMA